MRLPAGADASSVAQNPAELARLATGGDDEAFAELVRRYQRRVYGYAWQHLRDSEEARDAAQEVFVKLYRGLRRYDPERPFDAWFWRLVANAVSDHAQRRVPVPLAPEDLPEPPSPPAALDLGLDEALAALSREQRTPLLLHYYAGLNLEEIAQTLQVTVPALKSRMHRTRAVLRQALTAAAG